MIILSVLRALNVLKLRSCLRGDRLVREGNRSKHARMIHQNDIIISKLPRFVGGLCLCECHPPVFISDDSPVQSVGLTALHRHPRRLPR